MKLTLTQDDTAPDLAGTVSANLTGATAEVHIARPDKTVLTKAATVTDAATGAWSVGWDAGDPSADPPVPGDLAQTGQHVVEVQVTFGSGKVQTFAVDAAGSATRFTVRKQIA